MYGGTKPMIERPRDSQNYMDNTADEIESQVYMDTIYETWGFTVDRSKAGYHFDCELTRDDKHYIIEEKFRKDDWGDFGVEMSQCLVLNQSGWFYYVDCDRLNYVVVDEKNKPTRCYVVMWDDFRKWYLEVYLVENKHPYVFISNKGKGLTMSLSVPWDKMKGLYKLWRNTNGL